MGTFEVGLSALCIMMGPRPFWVPGVDCGGLNEERSPQAQVPEYSVPSWWHCLGSRTFSGVPIKAHKELQFCVFVQEWTWQGWSRAGASALKEISFKFAVSGDPTAVPPCHFMGSPSGTIIHNKSP